MPVSNATLDSKECQIADLNEKDTGGLIAAQTKKNPGTMSDDLYYVPYLKSDGHRVGLAAPDCLDRFEEEAVTIPRDYHDWLSSRIKTVDLHSG